MLSKKIKQFFYIIKSLFYTSALIFFVNSYAHDFKSHFEENLIKSLERSNFHTFEDLQRLRDESEIYNLRGLSDRYKNQIIETMSKLGLSFNGIPEDEVIFKDSFKPATLRALLRNGITSFQDLQNLKDEEALRNLNSIGETKAEEIISVMASKEIFFNSASTTTTEPSEEIGEASTPESQRGGFFFWFW